MILMCEAPRRSSSRTALRTASAPSAITANWSAVIRTTAGVSRFERVVSRTEVTMAAGLRDNTAAVKQPRHRTQQAILDGQSQANVGSPDVAKRGEAAIEARSQKPRRKVRQIGHGRLHHPDDIQPGRINMNVGIDQPWHQDTAAAVDDLVIVRREALGNLADTTAFHKYVFVRLAVFPIRRRRCGRTEIQFSSSLQVTPQFFLPSSIPLTPRRRVRHEIVRCGRLRTSMNISRRKQAYSFPLAYTQKPFRGARRDCDFAVTTIQPRTPLNEAATEALANWRAERST